MSKEIIYADGVFVFRPHENAPDFVKCDVSIDPDRFIEFLQKQEKNEKGYVSFQIKSGQKGLYMDLNTYRKQGNSENQEDDLPF